MAYTYIDRLGTRIDKISWTTLQQDLTYRILREFDNGVVFIRLIWNGRLTKQQTDSFRDTWPVFQMVVGNYDSKGNLVRDPNMDGETYAYENAAIKHYEEFLETWTNSYKDGDEFVEVDNTLAPPPPPDPDIPTSTVKDLPSGFAAW